MRRRVLCSILGMRIRRMIYSRRYLANNVQAKARTTREGSEMAKKIDLIGTIKGSLLEDFYPRGWDLKKIDRCCEMGLKKLTTPGKWWNGEFLPRAVADVAEMDRRMGDEIADQIESTRREGRKLAIILPVGPMGM